jgi:alkyldihydroxyacetonephosphate synthase
MVMDTKLPVPPMKWDGWGDPARVTELSSGQLAMVNDLLGVSAADVPAVALDQVTLAPSSIPADDVVALAAIVGSAHVSTADGDRLLRAGGKSTPDLLRRRSRAAQDAPDAVVVPGTEDEIVALLALCAGRGIAVVPFGGGTSVVGGLDPVRGAFATVISLDLRRFDQLEALDEVDQVATLGAGVSGPAAEALLAGRGFELGHYPQSFRYATIGGFAATRSAGQDSAGFGRFDDMVRGLRVVTPIGVLELGRPGPRTAAGPDLRQLFLGSEGLFGVITSVQLRVHPVPAAKAREAWTFPDFATGAGALRAVEQLGTGPTVLRLSDEVETAMNLATVDDAGGGEVAPPGGCLGITVFEGTPALVAERHAATRQVLLDHGGTSLGAAPARTWEEHRFDGPYLRDPLLANGALVETLETATSWSNLGALKQAVTDTVQAGFTAAGSVSLVLCHISHVYDTGASLYFTVIGAQRGDAIAQWTTIKAAVNDVLTSHGGTITHHHAVGADHRSWMTPEVGEVGVQILRAVKATLDPAGILNPGKLIP